MKKHTHIHNPKEVVRELARLKHIEMHGHESRAMAQKSPSFGVGITVIVLIVGFFMYAANNQPIISFDSISVTGQPTTTPNTQVRILVNDVGGRYAPGENTEYMYTQVGTTGRYEWGDQNGQSYPDLGNRAQGISKLIYETSGIHDSNVDIDYNGDGSYELTSVEGNDPNIRWSQLYDITPSNTRLGVQVDDWGGDDTVYYWNGNEWYQDLDGAGTTNHPVLVTESWGNSFDQGFSAVQTAAGGPGGGDANGMRFLYDAQMSPEGDVQFNNNAEWTNLGEFNPQSLSGAATPSTGGTAPTPAPGTPALNTGNGIPANDLDQLPNTLTGTEAADLMGFAVGDVLTPIQGSYAGSTYIVLDNGFVYSRNSDGSWRRRTDVNAEQLRRSAPAPQRNQLMPLTDSEGNPAGYEITNVLNSPNVANELTNLGLTFEQQQFLAQNRNRLSHASVVPGSDGNPELIVVYRDGFPETIGRDGVPTVSRDTFTSAQSLNDPTLEHANEGDIVMLREGDRIAEYTVRIVPGDAGNQQRLFEREGVLYNSEGQSVYTISDYRRLNGNPIYEDQEGRLLVMNNGNFAALTDAQVSREIQFGQGNARATYSVSRQDGATTFNLESIGDGTHSFHVNQNTLDAINSRAGSNGRLEFISTGQDNAEQVNVKHGNNIVYSVRNNLDASNLVTSRVTQEYRMEYVDETGRRYASADAGGEGENAPEIRGYNVIRSIIETDANGNKISEMYVQRITRISSESRPLAIYTGVTYVGREEGGIGSTYGDWWSAEGYRFTYGVSPLGGDNAGNTFVAVREPNGDQEYFVIDTEGNIIPYTQDENNPVEGFSQEDIDDYFAEQRSKIRWNQAIQNIQGYQGLSGFSSLFFSDEMLGQWRETVDKWFATYYLGTEYWASRICAAKVDLQNGAIAYTETPSGTLATSAHIEGQITKFADFNHTSGLFGQQSVYKITWFVNNVPSRYRRAEQATEPLEYNIELSGGGKTVKLFREDREVEVGESDGSGKTPVVQASNTQYTQVCLVFNPPISTISKTGEEVRKEKVCNKFSEYAGGPTDVDEEGDGESQGEFNQI